MSESAQDKQAIPGETASTTPAAAPPPPAPYVPPALPPYAAATAAAGFAAPSPGYSQPQGYAPPQSYAPPQAYAPPQGYAPPPQGYAPPPQGYGPYAPPPRPPAQTAGGSALGVIAFVLSVIAALGATIVGSIAAYNIGLGTGRVIALQPMDITFDWAMLTPVREWVLMGEVAFWVGTVLGAWAIAQGIVAIVRNRGRGWGIAAVVVAMIGPIAFAIGVQVFLTVGFASGASIGG